MISSHLTSHLELLPAILSLNGTSLSGLIPDSFETFSKLEYADFSNSYFSGPLPQTIFNLPSISALYFNNNFLTGTIPANFLSSPLLRDLYLSNNRFTGTLPDIEPGQSKSALSELLIEGNNLSGPVPSSICELRGFEAMGIESDAMNVAGFESRVEELSIAVDHCGAPKRVTCDCCVPCLAFTLQK